METSTPTVPTREAGPPKAADAGVAGRAGAWVVLSGVGIASFSVHGLSVTIGHFLGLTLPDRPIAFAVAIAVPALRIVVAPRRGAASSERPARVIRGGRCEHGGGDC